MLGRQAKPEFRLPDLAGLRLATVSEVPTPWMCLQEDLRRAGLDPARLDRVSDRSMSENSQALRRGEVDVVQLFQPFVEALLEDGAGHIWSAAADRGPTSIRRCMHPDGCWRRGARRCEGMVRAIYRTLKWVHAGDGRRLAAAIADYFPELPQARLAKALDRYLSLGI